MFPPEQFPGQDPPSAATLRVPPGLQGTNPVNRPTSSSSTPPPGPPSSADERPPISLPTTGFRPPVALLEWDVATIAQLPPLPGIFKDDYDADDERDDSSDMGGAEGNPPISLMETKFFLKQFAKRMGQTNYSALNKWKRFWVPVRLEKNHRSILQGQNHLITLRDGPLHLEPALAAYFTTSEIWLPLYNLDHAEWIRQLWVVMFLKQCLSAFREARIKEWQGNK